MAFTRREAVDIIFKTLDFDRCRPCYVDGLIQTLYQMGVICNERNEINVRVIICELLRSGKLDMTPNGELYIPEDPDGGPSIEKFEGSYFVTVDGRIEGPMSKGRAEDVCKNANSKIRKV